MVVDFPLQWSAILHGPSRIDFNIPVYVADNDHVDVHLLFTHDCGVVAERYRYTG